MIIRSRSRARSTIRFISSAGITAPVGLLGVLTTMARVREVTLASRADALRTKSSSSRVMTSTGTAPTILNCSGKVTQ